MDTAVYAACYGPSRSPRIKCTNCAFTEWALPARLTSAEAGPFDEQIVHCRIVKRGNYVHRSGDLHTSLNIVNSGFLKTFMTNRNGQCQITHFHMRGDLIGLDALGDAIHQCDTIALADACLCAIDYSCFEQLMHDIPALQRRFHQKVGAEIAHYNNAMASIGATSADERIAEFLLELSARFAAIGCSKLEFRLPMRRLEIGEYLGLRLETVSRVLARLHEIDAIAIDGRAIRIKNLLRLRQAATT
jgi:CRP/FNR family transcriptional regulator